MYFVLACGISWLLWLPRIATVQGWWEVDVPDWWHYTGAAGPISAAFLVTALTEGRRGVIALLQRYSPRRAPLPWLAFALLSPCLLLALGLVMARLVDGSWPAYGDLAATDNLPALGLPLILLVHILTFGLGEETGWRGFALPHLQTERNALAATHLLTIAWGLWHIPMFFENESMMSMSAFEIAGWGVALWMGAIFLTWLFNSSNGSLLVVVLWHGLFNLFSASEIGSTAVMVISMGVILIAIAALRLAGPDELRGWSHDAGGRQKYPV